jgi:hypothetical protein
MTEFLWGDTLSLDGSWQKLSDITTPMKTLAMRNGIGNGVVVIGKGAGQIIGYIKGDEVKTFGTVRPMDIWVLGTPGQNLYWDGQQ